MTNKIQYILTLLLAFSLLLCCINCRQKTTTEPVYLQKPTDTVRTILKQAYKARSTDLNASVRLYNEAIRIGKLQNDNAGLINAYRSAVFVSSTMMNNVDTAIIISDEALRFAHNLDDANTLCDMYGMRAVAFQVNGDTDSAIFYSKKALQYMDVDPAPDSVKNWPLYLNVADLYSQLGNQQLAIEFTEKYKNEYVLKVKDTLKLISCYNNLAVYYNKLNDTINSYANTYKALNLHQLKPDRQNQYSVYQGMFAMHNNRKNYDSATYYNRANIQLMEEVGNKVALFNLVISDVEMTMHKGTTAAAKELLSSPHFTVAFHQFATDEIDIPLEYKTRFAQNLSKVYEQAGDEKKAYQMLQTANTLSKQLNTQTNTRELEQFELERRKIMQENVVLAKQVQIEQKNNTIWALAALSILILSAAVSIYVWYNRKHTLQRKKIELMQKEQEWERNTLQLKTQLDERNRISRELHDDLGASLTTIVMEANMLNDQVEDGINAIKKTANESITALNEIVWTLNGRNDSLHSLVAYTRKYATSFLEKTGIQLKISEQIPDEDIIVSSNRRRALYLTVKEALNNIAKHSGATKVDLQTNFKDGVLMIAIKDNGKGLPTVDNHEKLMGNGLHNMKSNIENIGGSIRFESNKGTTLKINLNLS